jgi:AbiTii
LPTKIVPLIDRIAVKLLDEIVTLAAGESGSVATLLRKCLVLAHTLKNDRLKIWAENELNGYGSEDPGIPEYRKIRSGAKGFLLVTLDRKSTISRYRQLL